MSGKTSKEKWYYDSCTLDRDKRTYAEIINKNHPKTVLISYLSLGEAYGNCHRKGKEEAEAFLELIEKARDFIEVVDNDSIEEIFEELQEEFDRLSMTDAIHIATAILHGCNILRTTDRDLYGLSRKKIREIAERFGVSRFSITKMTDPK